ncbi:MAG TPA: hypothetical protein VFH39_02180 [Candidatus Saccharimonadales bacterium]|nr:hypothetical protein [Candidatus Saccharimonadales bacterium]
MSQFEDFKKHFNAEASQRLSREAYQLRRDLLKASGTILKQVLLLDLDIRNSAEEGDRIEHWAMRDEQAAPAIDEDQIETTISFLLEGHPEPHGTPKRLRLHVPVPYDFDIDDQETIESLHDPAAVYAERLDVRGSQLVTLGRYAVTPEVAYSYQAPVDRSPGAADQVGTEDIDTMWAHLERRVETTIPVLKLYEDIVNWNLISQRQSTFGG